MTKRVPLLCFLLLLGITLISCDLETFLDSSEKKTEEPSGTSEDADAIGGTMTGGRTKAEIAKKYEALKPSFTNPIWYASAPVTTGTHSPGELKEGFITDGVNPANYCRYLAGLHHDLVSDSALTINAQYGSVLLAEIGHLDHKPSKPSGMSDEFYAKAYEATSSSNLMQGSLTLWETVQQAYMRDDDVGNMNRIGHRRWVLNPTLTKVGFGYAKSATDSFSTMKVFDTSGTASDYDYVAWPSGGYFPREFFDANDPWSVSLNPLKYASPALSELAVTLTRKSDSKKWTLNASDSTTSAGGEYLNVDTNYYGIPICIIFRPLVKDISDTMNSVYWNKHITKDVYSVQISGLKKTSGQDASIGYKVEFFALSDVK